MTLHKIEEFKPDQYVMYVPDHAKGDIKHKDCEYGHVSSVNDKYVFVRFAYSGNNPVACRPGSLFILES